MKYYLKALYQSFKSPRWLASQSLATGKAGSFFVMVMLILSIGVGVHVVYRQIPTITPVLQKGITENIPDFTAHLASGVLTITDLPQPYTRYFDADGRKLVIVIDTVSTSTASVTSFFSSSTKGGILITGTKIISENLEGDEHTEQTLDRFPTMSFSKTQLIELLHNVSTRFRPAIFAVVTMLTFAVWGLGLIIFTLLFSLIAYALYSMITKQEKVRRYSWKEVFTFSLFVFGLPKLIITALQLGFYISLPYVLLACMVVGLIRVLSIPKLPPEQQNSSETPKIQ